LLIGGDRFGARTCGFAAYIYYCGAFCCHLEAMLDGTIGIEKFAAIAEGIGRYVQYAHYKGAGCEIEASCHTLYRFSFGHFLLCFRH
jgi:hypothetical protein